MTVDEAALFCDFAETYHIVNFRALPAQTAALLAHGLGENSRIKRALTGTRHSLTDLLLALAVDRLSVLVWQNSADGQAGQNRPKSLYLALTGQADESEVEAFDSAEAFEAARYGGGA